MEVLTFIYKNISKQILFPRLLLKEENDVAELN